MARTGRPCPPQGGAGLVNRCAAVYSLGMNTAVKFLALAALAVLLSACAGSAPPAPPPPLQAVPPQPLAAQNWARPTLFYATSRNVLDPGTDTRSARYGGARSREVSYGEVRGHLSGAGAGAVDRMDVRADIERVAKYTRQRFVQELERAAARTPGRDVVVFIHGYGNTFEDAAKSALRIGHGVGASGALVLYSWPSAGSAPAYMADRNNAYWAVHSLKEFLADVTASPWIGRVSVVVHSMGNEAFIRAYSELAGECSPAAGSGAAGMTAPELKKVRNIVLAAPDMDREIFLDQYAARMTSLGARVTLYASRSDVALMASASVQGGEYERLGKNVVCIPGLMVADATDVKTDVLGHSWISDSRAVLTDLRCALTEGCNRLATGYLREAICTPDIMYALPEVSARGGLTKANSGQFYWRLNVGGGQNGAKAPAATAGQGGMLDSLGIRLPW